MRHYGWEYRLGYYYIYSEEEWLEIWMPYFRIETFVHSDVNHKDIKSKYKS